ncbi:MAG: efflux RND transporter periplasmic adaptor subunit [Acidobacteria bacterium]|nr:efflux RND transporter periplasmic adaptor subunit [Acidobacteriota bacterium]
MTDRFTALRKFWIIAIFLGGMAAGAFVFERMSHSDRAKGASAKDEPSEEHQPSGRLRMDAAAQKNIGLRFEPAQLRPVTRSLQATGVVSPNESRVAHVRPLAQGRIEKVNVRLGDRVRAGQVLLVYDNIELGEIIGQYSAAVAALGKAKAEAEVTQRSLDRAKALVDVGALARAELEKRTAEYKNALASIESQDAELAKTEEKLHRFGLDEAAVKAINPREGAGSHREGSHSRMTAPFDGIVIKYNAAEGEAFGPSDEVFTIADLSTAWVLADVYEKDIALIRAGQEARIVTDAYPGETFLGKITYVSDFLDPKTRTAKVRCEVPNRDGKLKLDMFATVQLPTPANRQALLIPAAAIQQVNDRPVVFVRTSEIEFEPRSVELGSQSDGWVEVKNGIKEGETVVAHGSFFLKSALLRSQIGGEE